MKTILRIVSSIILIGILIASSVQGLNNYKEIEKIEEKYQKYYTQETKIKVKLEAEKGDYLQKKQLYEKIAKEEEVEDMDITYSIQIGGSPKILNETNFLFLNKEIVEGRYFTEEELSNGEFVTIMRESSLTFEGVKPGDTIEIFPYGDEQFTGIKVKVIGFYKMTFKHEGFDSLDSYFYMPLQAMEEIMDIWEKDALLNDLTLYSYFDMKDPTIICKNEENYDKLEEKLKKYRQFSSFDFDITRYDHHQVTDDRFSTTYYTNKLKESIVIDVICLILLVVIEIVSYIAKVKKQKKYEEKLMQSQEKNIQNVLMINQQSRKMKHDMKHLSNMISNLLNQNEIEKAKEVLGEYSQEIEKMSIPAFTQNQTIDLLINSFITKAKKNHLQFEYSSVTIPALPISDMKLYVLLSNALDNAFEHCDTEKRIQLEISYVGSYYRFIIKNDIVKEETKRKRKEEHGFGMMSMNQIIKEVGGEITYEITDHHYICTILIPSKMEEVYEKEN